MCAGSMIPKQVRMAAGFWRAAYGRPDRRATDGAQCGGPVSHVPTLITSEDAGVAVGADPALGIEDAYNCSATVWCRKELDAPGERSCLFDEDMNALKPKPGPVWDRNRSPDMPATVRSNTATVPRSFRWETGYGVVS